MSKPQRKFPIDFFDTLGEDPFLVADAVTKPVGPAARVSRERVPAFPEDADEGYTQGDGAHGDGASPSDPGRSTYEPSPERRASTRSVFFADNRPAVAERTTNAFAQETLLSAQPPPSERTATQRVVLVARNGSATEGMEALDTALVEGWRVAHVAPTSAEGPHFSALVFLERV